MGADGSILSEPGQRAGSRKRERPVITAEREGEGGRGLILLSFIVFVCRRVQNYVKWGLNPQVQMY